MAIGIPWETTVSDYMISNDVRKVEISNRIKVLSKMAESNTDVIDKEKNLKNIQAFYLLDQNYINGTKYAIEENYGDIFNYLHSIGIEASTVDKIKRNLLD